MNATSAQPISVKALADAVLARNSGRNERTTRELRPPQLEACETPQKLRQLRPEVDPESQLLRRLSLACDGVCFPDGSPFTVQWRRRQWRRLRGASIRDQCKPAVALLDFGNLNKKRRFTHAEKKGCPE